MIGRVALALMIGGLLPARASAQSAPAPQPHPKALATAQGPSGSGLADIPPPPPKPFEAPTSASRDPAASPKRMITQPAPLPRRIPAPNGPVSLSRRDSEAVQGRFANPGGVGRYAEYYTANTPTSQLNMHPMPLARFDQGGGPNRAEQIAAFRAGQLRTRNIQDNINAYGRPYGAFGAGFGFGLGLGFGRGFGFPN
jgi:hypothetical protein